MSNNNEKKGIVYIYINYIGISISLYEKDQSSTKLIDLKSLNSISKNEISAELTKLLKVNKILDKSYEDLTIAIHTTSKHLVSKLSSKLEDDLDFIFEREEYNLCTVKKQIDNNDLNDLYLLFISSLDDCEVIITDARLAKRFKAIRSNYISEGYHVNPKLELYSILLGYKKVEGLGRKYCCFTVPHP